jgi:ribonuclease HII
MIAKFDLALLPPCPNLAYEQALWQQGVYRVAGIDEAGRGPLAGPVFAAAVIFPPEMKLETELAGVNDSKKMSPEARLFWAQEIKEHAVYYGIGSASAAEIDLEGIVPAVRLAINRALAQIPCSIEHLLLDFIRIPGSTYPQTALVKGDARSLSIAAASILAKTARDALMCELELTYPGYGFSGNKGYGTQGHLKALSEKGPCAIHRHSFRPIRAHLSTEEEIQ